jgi:hypothetical protein
MRQAEPRPSVRISPEMNAAGISEATLPQTSNSTINGDHRGGSAENWDLPFQNLPIYWTSFELISIVTM